MFSVASRSQKPPAVWHYCVAGSTPLWGPCGSLHVAPVLVPITMSENCRWTQDRIWKSFLSMNTCGWFRVYDQETVRRCMHLRNLLRWKTLSAICALFTQPVSSSGSRSYEKPMQGRVFVSVPCHAMARQVLSDWREPALSCTMSERARVLDYRPVDGLPPGHSMTSEHPSLLVQDQLLAWQNIVSMRYMHVGNGEGLSGPTREACRCWRRPAQDPSLHPSPGT